MEGTPLSRVFVDSEVGELKAVVVHSPETAHRHIMPEHIEGQLAIKEYALRRLRLSEPELDALYLTDSAGQKIRIAGGEELKLHWRTRDGSEGALDLGGALEHLFIENPQYVLFDDLVDADRIAAEHKDFERVLRTSAPHTLRLAELLFDALHLLFLDAALRDEFFRRLELMSDPPERGNVRQSREYFEEHGERRFLQLLLSGRDHRGHYVMHPLPNLLFTRDLAAQVGNTLVLSSAAKAARGRESVLAWLVFTRHPLFANLAAAGQLRHVDMLAARFAHPTPHRVALEGGDMLLLGNGTLLVGTGERTTAEGVIELARLLWNDAADSGSASPSVPHSGIERIVMVQILHSRASMHLDTIFTLAWQNGNAAEAMVYGPYLHDGGYGELSAWDLAPDMVAGGKRPQLSDLPELKHTKLDDLLSRAGLNVEPMFCGQRTSETSPGSRWEDPEHVFIGRLPHALNARREQWTDGANLFALAPGIVLTYARNYHSIDEMARRGYQVIDPDSFCRNSRYLLQAAVEGRPASKHVVAIGGSELCRGRGGPRCMTLPLWREPLSKREPGDQQRPAHSAHQNKSGPPAGDLTDLAE